MRQFFINESVDLKKDLKFNKEDNHHIKNVLRLKSGTKLRLIIMNVPYFVQVVYKDGWAYASIIEEDPNKNDTDYKLILIQAVIKGDKWDLIVQKASELGVSDLVPLISERVNIKTNFMKRERFEKIALEASKQSNRESILRLHDPISIKECKKYLSDNNLFAYEAKDYKKEGLLSKLRVGKDTTIIIGCEGGFTKEEATSLIEDGFEPVCLGKRILRAETAAIYSLSLINAKNEVFDEICD